MFVFFVSKIIFLLFFSQTCYTLCFSPSVVDFLILFIEKVKAISMNSFTFPPSKLTHFHYLSVLCLLSTSLTERPALTPGLRSYPSHSWYSTSLFFSHEFSPLLNSLIIHMVYWLLALKRLSLTLHTPLATIFSSLQSVANVIYFKKERVVNGIECYWEVKGSQNWTHERAPVIHRVPFHICSFWPPQSSFCPITPLKLLLSGFPEIPSSHILYILNLSATFNAVESCLLKILILLKAELETKTCK